MALNPTPQTLDSDVEVLHTVPFFAGFSDEHLKRRDALPIRCSHPIGKRIDKRARPPHPVSQAVLSC